MNYVRKKFADAANRVISWFSTDDNVLCQNGKYLNENLDRKIDAVELNKTTLTFKANNKTVKSIILPTTTSGGDVSTSFPYIEDSSEEKELIIHNEFTVMNALTHATTSNLANAVDTKAAYSAVITPDPGFTIESIVITMNGVDITSNVLRGYVINIPSVMGNVLITVTAKATA